MVLVLRLVVMPIAKCELYHKCSKWTETFHAKRWTPMTWAVTSTSATKKMAVNSALSGVVIRLMCVLQTTTQLAFIDKSSTLMCLRLPSTS